MERKNDSRGKKISLYPLHSVDEYRYVLLGYSHRNRLLVVVHTERNNHIRIISARPALAKERLCYEERTE